MTSEDAKKAISDLKAVHQIYDVACGDWSFCWTAIEALEKHIQKTADHITREHAWAEKIGNCPRCNKFVRSVWKYCPECSQAISLEDNDE